MPDFDYKSFMAGLQVGRRIRLWDASANKPPMPPAPSGRYILMEDGTPIVTELTPPDNVLLYSTGVWYNTIYHELYDYKNKRRFRWSGGKELPIFPFYFNGEEYRWIMFISETPLIGTTFYYDREYEVFNASTGQWEIRTETTDFVVSNVYPRAGAFYVYYSRFGSAGAQLYDYPAFVYKEFPRQAVGGLDTVCDYVATFKLNPIITE